MKMAYQMKNKNQHFKSFNSKRPILFYLLAFLLFCLLPAKTYAQQARVISIVPPTVQEVLDPAGKAEGTMKVLNDSDQPITFKANVQDYIVQDTQGTPVLLPPNTLGDKYAASAWIGITPDTFTIPAHDKQSLNYFIQTPKGARPGGHYAAIVFSPVNTNGLVAGSGATIDTEVGTLFYITINGPITENAQVTSMAAHPFQEYGPVTINAQIKNLGDLHIKPLGYISIYNTIGTKVETLNLPANNIFPGAARDYTAKFDNGFLIGRYKAVLLASYGINGNLPLAQTIYFWVFPWKIASLIVLILIALILAGILYRRRKKNKQPAAQPTEEQTTTQ